MTEFARQSKEKSVLVIGVGYKASRAVNDMFIQNENPAINFALVDTDSQILNHSIIPQANKVCIKLYGSGCLGNDQSKALDSLLAPDYRIVFILSDLDIETGTSIPALIAARCMRLRALVILVLAYPFYLKGMMRKLKDDFGYSELRRVSDAVFMFSHNQSMKNSRSMESRFLEPIDVILNMIALEGYINIDFKDVETVFRTANMLSAVMSGIGQGEERVQNVVSMMDESPFIAEVNTNFTDTILICFESGSETEFLMNEIAFVMDYFQVKFGSDAKIIWGNCINPLLTDKVRVTAIITQSSLSKKNKNSTMIELTQLADQLNDLLSTDELNMETLRQLAHELEQLPDIRTKLVDFEMYNEDNLARLTAEKFTKIKEQDFEAGANAREQEKECLKYTNFQKYFKLSNSFFYPEEDKLFYFHLGTEKNDHQIKTILFGD